METSISRICRMEPLPVSNIFDFADGKISEIKVTLRGNGTGTMKVYTDLEKEPVASIAVETGKRMEDVCGENGENFRSTAAVFPL